VDVIGLRRLRILFCVWNYFPAPAGGAERQARLQAEELARRGHEVTVVCPRHDRLPSGTIGGVDVRRLPRLQRRPLSRITYLISLVAFVAANVRRFDLVHVHQANVHADLVVPLARLARRPTYVKVACGGSVGEIARLRKMAQVTRWIGMRLAHRVQALSDEIASELRSIKIKQNRIVEIANGIDLDGFGTARPEEKLELRRRLDLPPKSVVVLYAGRFARYKGLADLLAVWRARSRGGATLVLVGSAAVDAPIGKIQPAPDLIVRDWTNSIRDYLQAADVFVYPSYADGMSNALMEAMACGLACVASCSGATSALITDGESGLLFAPGDRDALAVALHRAVGDVSLRARLGRTGLHAIRRFSIENVVTDIENCYAELLKTG